MLAFTKITGLHWFKVFSPCQTLRLWVVHDDRWQSWERCDGNFWLQSKLAVWHLNCSFDIKRNRVKFLQTAKKQSDKEIKWSEILEKPFMNNVCWGEKTEEMQMDDSMTCTCSQNLYVMTQQFTMHSLHNLANPIFILLIKVWFYESHLTQCSYWTI